MTHSTHGHTCRCPEHHPNQQPPPRGADSLWAALVASVLLRWVRRSRLSLAG